MPIFSSAGVPASDASLSTKGIIKLARSLLTPTSTADSPEVSTWFKGSKSIISFMAGSSRYDLPADITEDGAGGGLSLFHDTTYGTFRQGITGAASGNEWRWFVTNMGVRRDGLRWLLYMRLYLGASVANMRIWMAAQFSGGFLGGNTDSPLHTIGWRYSSGVSANWMAYTNDGSGGGTAADSGVAAAASTVHGLVVEKTEGGVYQCSLLNSNDDLVYSTTFGSDLPQTGVDGSGGLYVVTNEAVAKTVRAASVYEKWQ